MGRFKSFPGDLPGSVKLSLTHLTGLSGGHDSNQQKRQPGKAHQIFLNGNQEIPQTLGEGS